MVTTEQSKSNRYGCGFFSGTVMVIRGMNLKRLDIAASSVKSLWLPRFSIQLALFWEKDLPANGGSGPSETRAEDDKHNIVTAFESTGAIRFIKGDSDCGG